MRLGKRGAPSDSREKVHEPEETPLLFPPPKLLGIFLEWWQGPQRTQAISAMRLVRPNAPGLRHDPMHMAPRVPPPTLIIFIQTHVSSPSPPP